MGWMYPEWNERPRKGSYKPRNGTLYLPILRTDAANLAVDSRPRKILTEVRLRRSGVERRFLVGK